MTQASQRFTSLSRERQELVERVLRKEGHASAPPTLRPRAADVRELPLSYAQESLWFMCHLAASNAVYNLPSAIRLRGPLDRAALERALGALVQRHDILRTRFPAPAGRPVQEILPDHRFTLPVVPCEDASPDERWRSALRLASQECTRPFDLAEAPPWRLCLYELERDDHILLTVFHHLVWDGWSIGVWIHELAQLYQAFTQGRPSPLPELPLQYADYALFQREWLSGERLDAQVDWWRERLHGMPPLALPTDRPRPAVPSYDGASEPFFVPPALSASVEELCHRTGTTPYMLLLAAFQALLHRYAGQERLVVGTPIASRRQREVEGLIGSFANITLMATDLSGEPTFTELLSRVRETATGAYAHQDIPFELLVDKLGVERDASRNPLFQVMFALHQEQLAALELPGLQVLPVPVDSERSHFDLGLHLWRGANGLHGHVSYSKDLFEPATIRRMIGHYLTLLEAAVREPERKLSSLPLLTDEEREWLREHRRVAPLRSELIEAFQKRSAHRLLHLYGPPELGTEVACWPLGATSASAGPNLVPLWLLDKRANPVPVGIPGTLHVEVPGNLLPTAERGVWLADGSLRLLGSTSRTVWHDGLRLHLADLEATLLQHPAVAAAHVLARPSTGGEELVCHVVPSGAVTREQLADHVRRHLPTPGLPVSFVLLGSLPLTPDGRVDEQALLALPVLDERLVATWEQRLAQEPGVARVKVLAREWSEPQTVVHVRELMPDFRPGRALERHTTTTSGTVSAESADVPPARPAYARGEPLPIPDEAPKTLGEALLRTAETWPERGITLLQGPEGPTRLTYPELLHRARCILSGLRARGLQAKEPVILQLEDLRDHLCAFWACILGGLTPVNVATSGTYEQKTGVVGKLHNVWKLLGHPVVLSSARLVGPLAGVPALYRVGSEPVEPLRALSIDELSGHPPIAELHPASPGDVAFFQLSSGSTGVPKCIQETHESIIDHIHGARAFNGYGPEDVSLNWLPFDHVVPTLTCHLKDTYLGIPQVHVKPDLVLSDPLLWLDLIERYRVTHGWAPNFGFKLVSEALAGRPGRSWDLGSVKRLINAGEQVTLPVCEEFLRRTAPFGMKPTVMQPGFGMAEVCTMVTYANDWRPETGTFRVRKTSLGGRLEEAAAGEDAIAFVDLGPVRPGVEMRIAGPDNRVLPECVIGVLQFRGRVTTPGYLHNPEANQEAFVGEGWFSSGDLGFMREGRLTITGRQKEVIIVRGANFYCYELEDVVNDTPGVEPTFSAACAVEDPSTGSEGLAIFFVPREPGLDLTLLRAVRERVTRSFGVSPAYVVPLDKAAFPKTTSGKIQRTQLKKDLIAGRFDALLARVDLALENNQTVPAWFHRPVWRRQELGFVPYRPEHANALVLSDGDDGPSKSLCESLGARAVRVERGSAFARVGPRAYTLDPLEPAHYDALLSSLEEERLAPEHVFHLWNHGAPGAEPESADELARASREASGSLLLLAQALARRQDARPVQLLVATSHTHAGAPGERIAYERAALRGLVKSLSQEWPTLSCRLVELPPREHEENATRLLHEALAATKDREVLYRDGGRWVQRLAPVKPEATGEPPWKRGDLVLLSGGLGGIGTELARELLEQHGLRLLLVGRTPLEGEETPAGEADALATRRSHEERLQAFRELERLGPIHHEVADVGDLPRLREAVARAEQRFGTKLAGVIHLAGVFPTRLLAEETPESLADTVYPKLVGAWALSRLLGDGGFFVGFGSVYGLFGGVGVGAYAAAHCALEAFLEDERRKGHARRHCFAFSHWDELGMSRGYQLVEQSLARGYMMIGRKRGLHSLLAGLRSGQSQLVVGLDGRRPHVRCHLDVPVTPTERLVAYVAPTSGNSLPAASRLEPLADRFGTPSPCELVVVPTLPLTPSGELDVGALVGLGGARSASAERILPRTGLERTIAAIWREVLQVDAVDVHTSFFALGGQSVLLVQVLSKLRKALGGELSVVDLFRYPTVSALASHLEKAEAAPKRSVHKATERAQKQREVARQRILTRGRPGAGDKKSP